MKARSPATARRPSSSLKNSAGFPEIAYSQKYLVDDEVKTRRAALRKLPAALWKGQLSIAGPFTQDLSGWKPGDFPHSYVLRETTHSHKPGAWTRVNYFIVGPSRDFGVLTMDARGRTPSGHMLDKGRDA